MEVGKGLIPRDGASSLTNVKRLTLHDCRSYLQLKN